MMNFFTNFLILYGMMFLAHELKEWKMQEDGTCLLAADWRYNWANLQFEAGQTEEPGHLEIALRQNKKSRFSKFSVERYRQAE